MLSSLGGGPGRIAGTTEVGVQKSACKKPGELRHVKVLLIPKTVWRRTLSETESGGENRDVPPFAKSDWIIG